MMPPVKGPITHLRPAAAFLARVGHGLGWTGLGSRRGVVPRLGVHWLPGPYTMTGAEWQVETAEGSVSGKPSAETKFKVQN